MSQHTGNYIYLFKTEAEYENARQNHYEEPWVGYCIQNSGYSYNSAATPAPTAELSISGPSTVPSTGGTFTINVISNTGWTLETEVGTLTPETGTGNGRVVLGLESNETGEDIEIVISAYTNPGGVLMVTHTITQSGEQEMPYVEIDVSGIGVPWPFYGGQFQITGTYWSDICAISEQVWTLAMGGGEFPESDGPGYMVIAEGGTTYLACLRSPDNYVYLFLYDGEGEQDWALVDNVQHGAVSSNTAFVPNVSGRYSVEGQE